jgi:hypothetical protein
MPKERLAALSQVQLRTIVSQIQDLVWFDVDKNAWDPDREWSMDTIEAISGVLDEYGLQPVTQEDADG